MSRSLRQGIVLTHRLTTGGVCRLNDVFKKSFDYPLINEYRSLSVSSSRAIFPEDMLHQNQLYRFLSTEGMIYIPQPLLTNTFNLPSRTHEANELSNERSQLLQPCNDKMDLLTYIQCVAFNCFVILCFCQPNMM